MRDVILPKGERAGVVKRLQAFLAMLSTGRAWKITVEEYRNTRSIQQNRYLWGVAYKLLSDATGYENDDIAAYLCGLYFGEREKRVPRSKNFPDGVEMVPVRTTTTNELGKRDVLTWDAFDEYVAFVQRFGAKHGILIPDPDPEWRMHKEDEE